MTKESDSDKTNNPWDFPEMEINQEFNVDITDGFEDNKELDEEEEDEIRVVESQAQADGEAMSQSVASALNEQNIELNRKMALLHAILLKVKEPLAFLDDQIINIFQDIIKKIVTKIVYKEIHTDPELIKKIVDDLKNLIHSRNGLISIYLSEDDFNRVKLDSDEINQSIHVDRTLSAGDIVINAKDMEIRALLNDRIDMLMGTLHD